MLDTVAIALPCVRAHIRYQQAGTPISFWRYTRRHMGMVGGLPQRRWNSGVLSLGPRAAGVRGLWLVGDSTFPGQSTAAVTQSGIRIYNAIRRDRLFPTTCLILHERPATSDAPHSSFRGDS
jgi:phytoene dehydrogenase-like protein